MNFWRFLREEEFGSGGRRARAVLTWKPGHYFFELLVLAVTCTVHGGFGENFRRFST